MVFVTLLYFRLLRYVLTGGVYVFHVCFDLCVVYGVRVCVNVRGVGCIVVCCLFLRLGIICCVVM